MVTRFRPVRDACALPPEQRTEEHISEIFMHVRNVKFFQKLKHEQQKALCRAMTLETFEARDIITRIGDVGDKFYVVISGSVAVQVPSSTAPCPHNIHDDKCTCPDRPLETVVFLEKGMGFGELALQSDQPRSATVQASEPTELLVITQGDYEAYAGKWHREFLDSRVQFLKECPRIGEALDQGLIEQQDLAVMASCLSESSLFGNEMAIRQGDSVDHMLFVRSGQFAVLRCVDVAASKADRRSKVAAVPEADALPLPTPSVAAVTASINLAKAVRDLKTQQRESTYNALIAKHPQAAGRTGTEAFFSAIVPVAQSRSLTAPAIAARNLEVMSEISSSDIDSLPDPGLAAQKLRASDSKPAKEPAAAKASAKHLLRIGSVGAYQYFGDHQVSSGDFVWPFP